MGFSEILLVMALALILFGPEDLQDIARKIGKMFFEIRKATNEFTQEFQNSMDSPTDSLNKASEKTTPPRVAQLETRSSSDNSIINEKLLTYECEIQASEESTKGKADSPLVELPFDKVSIKKRE